MSDLRIAVPFTAGQKNVSHTDLNNAINNAVIQKGFVTGKSALTTPDVVNDVLLIYDQSADQLKKITPNLLIFDNPEFITARPTKSPPDFADYVGIYDVAGAANKKTTLDDILGMLWLRSAYTTPTAADIIPILDNGTFTSKFISLADLVHGAVSHTAALGADSIPIYDSAGGNYRRLTINNLVGSLPALSAPCTADALMIYDSRNTTAKGVTLATLITGLAPTAAPTTGDFLAFYDSSTAVTPFSQTSAITRSGQTATFTKTSHGLSNGDLVNITGATQTEYNGNFCVFNVSANTFDYTVTGTPASPSTGTATVNTSTAVRKGNISDFRTYFQSGLLSGSTSQLCKGWVNFALQGSNGACTINKSYNVSGVSRTASGAYSITWASALPSVDYVVTGMTNRITGMVTIDHTTAPTTTVLKVEIYASSNGVGYDTGNCYLAVFDT